MIVNGWRLFYFRAFATTLGELEASVTELAKRDPAGYRAHPQTRLLASIYQAITQWVPADPNHSSFRLGKTLGREFTHWRRVKGGLPDRYRLFFRFTSKPVKVIVYAWINGEDTLRKAGAKTDVYATFQRMLERGEVPTSIEELMKLSTDPDIS